MRRVTARPLRRKRMDLLFEKYDATTKFSLMQEQTARGSWVRVRCEIKTKRKNRRGKTDKIFKRFMVESHNYNLLATWWISAVRKKHIEYLLLTKHRNLGLGFPYAWLPILNFWYMFLNFRFCNSAYLAGEHRIHCCSPIVLSLLAKIKLKLCIID